MNFDGASNRLALTCPLLIWHPAHLFPHTHLAAQVQPHLAEDGPDRGADRGPYRGSPSPGLRSGGWFTCAGKNVLFVECFLWCEAIKP